MATARQIIQSAILYIGLAPNEGDVVVDSSEPTRPFSLGLEALNQLMQHYSNTTDLIPYLREINFIMNSGQDIYVVSENPTLNPDIIGPKIQSLESVTYRYPDNETQYPVQIIPKNRYYGSYRSLNNQGNPIQVFVQNTTETSTIVFYPNPSLPFRATVRAKLTLPEIQFEDIDQVLEQVPPRSVYFLKLAVGRELAQIYEDDNVMWGHQKEKIFEQVEREISLANDIDLSVNSHFGNILANAQRVRGGF